MDLYKFKGKDFKGTFYGLLSDPPSANIILPNSSVVSSVPEGQVDTFLKNIEKKLMPIKKEPEEEEPVKKEPEEKVPEEKEPKEKVPVKKEPGKKAISDIIRKYALVLGAEKSLVLWADERYVGKLDKAKKKAVSKGKTSSGFDDQMVLNASKGYGVLFFIDALNKAGAMDVIDKVEPYPDKNIKNVYYYGDNAKENVKNALNMLRRV